VTGVTITDADRLQKLWEAYRVQEEEYRAAVAHAERLARELEGRDSAAAERERLVQEKEAQVAALQDEVARRDAEVARLRAVEEDAKALQAYKDRIAQLEAALAQEKERLAKLFLLYEELQRSAGGSADG
jgi:chromosome segregation ATPase